MSRSWIVLGLALLLALSVPVSAQEALAKDCSTVVCTAANGGEVQLSFKTHRTWKIKLPSEAFASVGTGFRFADSQGRDFAAKLEGTSLLVDTDGDGKFDAKAEGTSALLTLREISISLP